MISWIYPPNCRRESLGLKLRALETSRNTSWSMIIIVFFKGQAVVVLCLDYLILCLKGLTELTGNVWIPPPMTNQPTNPLKPATRTRGVSTHPRWRDLWAEICFGQLIILEILSLLINDDYCIDLMICSLVNLSYCLMIITYLVIIFLWLLYTLNYWGPQNVIVPLAQMMIFHLFYRFWLTFQTFVLEGLKW